MSLYGVAKGGGNHTTVEVPPSMFTAMPVR